MIRLELRLVIVQNESFSVEKKTIVCFKVYPVKDKHQSSTNKKSIKHANNMNYI